MSKVIKLLRLLRIQVSPEAGLEPALARQTESKLSICPRLLAGSSPLRTQYPEGGEGSLKNDFYHIRIVSARLVIMPVYFLREIHDDSQNDE